VRAARDVHHDRGDGLVERHLSVGEPSDAAPVTQRLVERLPEDDGDVLDGVVVVDVEVAVAVDGEIEQAVFGERVEHVVEEADAGVDDALAVTVDVEREVDRRLCRLAGDGGAPCHTCVEAGDE
jgi:hypothetical protein